MNITEVKQFIESCNDKNLLKELIGIIDSKMNSSINIGDNVTFIINYMIGDANGNTKREMLFENITQVEIDALTVVSHILNNYTSPNPGTWGFLLNSESFSKKPKDVYAILYEHEYGEKDEKNNIPETYAGKELTTDVLEVIGQIIDEVFTSETQYSFLVYKGYKIKQ